MSTAPVQLDEEALILEFVKQIEMPSGVKFKRVDHVTDWTGEPALRFYFAVSVKYPLTKERIAALNAMKSSLQDKVLKSGIPRWPSVSFLEVK